MLLGIRWTDLFIIDRGREHEPCAVSVGCKEEQYAGIPSRRAICVDLTIMCVTTVVEYFEQLALLFTIRLMIVMSGYSMVILVIAVRVSPYCETSSLGCMNSSLIQEPRLTSRHK